MFSSVKRLIIIVGLVCVLRSADATNVDHVKSWGDLSKPGSHFMETETKVGIPFIRREYIFDYPEDFASVKLPLDSYTIRGIKLVEKADETCEPIAEILKGGVDQKFARVKVTSASGCGLHSTVSFLADRPSQSTGNLI